MLLIQQIKHKVEKNKTLRYVAFYLVWFTGFQLCSRIRRNPLRLDNADTLAIILKVILGCISTRGATRLTAPGARNNFGALCSNLRSFGSKPKKALLALLGFSAPPRNHSAPTAVIRRPGNCAPLPTSLRLWFQLAQERCWPWLPSCHGNKVLISRKKSQKALKKAKHKTYT